MHRSRTDDNNNHNDRRHLRLRHRNLPLMPPRQQFSPVTLEELPIDEYETDSLLGSDDDLDDTTRAAKRRRIETLGALYLQGQPLFIASASLRGPFDNGWINPWKKNRSRNPTNVANTNRRGAATGLRRRAPSAAGDKKNGAIQDSEKGSKSLPKNKDYEHKSNPQDHSVSSTPAELGRRQPHSPFIVESLDCRMTEPPSTEFLIRQKWLKKDKGSFNIQNYDPPKSPSSRYTGTTGPTKRLKLLNKKPEPRSIRNISSSRTNGPDNKSKSISRNVHNGPSSPSNSPRSPDCAHPHLDLSKNSRPPKKSERTVDSTVVQAAHEGLPIEPTSASSVHIIPPSSHLPEFKYRLPKSKSVDQSKFESEIISTDASVKNRTNERDHPPLQSDLGDSNSRQASTQTKKDSGTLEVLGHTDERESSEKITSAQIVPRPLPNSGEIISLYSTDLRGGLSADDNAGVGGELSTQEALQLAQKSFQEEFSTPEKDLEDTSEPEERSKSPSKRITPFSRINTLPSKLEIQLAAGVGSEAIQNMDTQALIDSFTPFSVGTIKNAGISSASKPRVNTSASNSSLKRRASFVVSPPVSPSGNATEEVSNMHTEVSVNDSFPALPLTLSVTTPATEQQDGQEIMAGTDTFDLSQVIQDAGSWLQQSFEVGKDLKRSSQRSSPQSSGQALRREVSPT